MDTAALWMGIFIVAFGAFVWSAGIVIFVKLWIEIKWWSGLAAGLLAMDMSPMAPESMAGLVPLFQMMAQQVVERLVWDAKQATIVVSVGLFLLGLGIQGIGIYMLCW